MIHKTLLILMFLFANMFAADQSVEYPSTMTGSIMNVVMNQTDSVAGLGCVA